MNEPIAITFSSVSFGEEGVEANSHTISTVDARIDGIIGNPTDPEYAKLAIHIPENTNDSIKLALGFHRILPLHDIHLSVKLSVLNGPTILLPNCIARSYTENWVKLESYIYDNISGDSWWAEVNGVKLVRGNYTPLKTLIIPAH